MNEAKTDEMTTDEAAQYLSERLGGPVSTEAIHALRSAGRGPMATKRGSRLYFRPDTLDAFVASMTEPRGE